jgi:hypothetical protein
MSSGWISVHADDPRRPLTGTFRLAGALQFGDIEDGTSHFYFYLDGEIARSMYDSLTSEPVENECGGGLVKRAGALECTRSSEDFRCEFSLEHETQKIGIASTC